MMLFSVCSIGGVRGAYGTFISVEIDFSLRWSMGNLGGHRHYFVRWFSPTFNHTKEDPNLTL
jgi:hypothetical protein